MKKRTVLLMLLMLLLIPATLCIPVKRIDVILFHSETCGTCAKVDQFLSESMNDYPIMIIQKFDIKTEYAQRIYDLFKTVYDLDIEGYPVPTVIIGRDVFSGSRESTLRLMDEKLEDCFTGECTITIVRDTDIIISDSTPTPTPRGLGSWPLFLFMGLAGIFSCLNPYTMAVTARVRKERAHGLAYMTGYGVTSLLLCLALINVLMLCAGSSLLEIGLVGIAGGLGVLSLLTAAVQLVKIPQGFQKSMHQLLVDKSRLSLFCLGIGMVIASLLYTAGIYLLVGYHIMPMSLVQRIITSSIFVLVQVFMLITGYFIMIQSHNWLHLTVGMGSILLAILSWMVW